MGRRNRLRRIRWKWLAWGSGGVTALLAAAAALVLLSLPQVQPLQDRRGTFTIQVRDWQGREHPYRLGPANRWWIPLEQVPELLRWAVIVAEDGNFYRHEGVDLQAVREAIRHDLEQKRLARGASTITQQLAKNLYLSREKSLVRKGRELLIARRLEAELSKGRILELYLNLVELGPLVHGVEHGAHYYFGKPPAALSPRESAFLAAILPGPRVAYNPSRNLRKVEKRTDHLLRLLRQRGILTEEAYRQALAEELAIVGLEKRSTRPAAAAAEPDDPPGGDLGEEDSPLPGLEEAAEPPPVEEPFAPPAEGEAPLASPPAAEPAEPADRPQTLVTPPPQRLS